MFVSSVIRFMLLVECSFVEHPVFRCVCYRHVSCSSPMLRGRNSEHGFHIPRTGTSFMSVPDGKASSKLQVSLLEASSSY